MMFSCEIQAFSAPNVSVEDPVYRKIDKLVASGLVKDIIYGQRPWSRREIARLLDVARRNRQAMEGTSVDQRDAAFWSYIDGILRGMERRYGKEVIETGVRIHPLEEIRLDYRVLDTPFRAIPNTVGIGEVDADVNPLMAYWGGRHIVDGNILSLETMHRAQLSRYLSLYLQPRLELRIPNTGTADVHALVQHLYGKFAYKNFEFQIGRDSLVWGQGANGGLMFSSNARPLDMMKITTSAPFYHPWIFKHLGPSKYTFFIGNMGPERDIRYAYIYGVRAAIRPASILELGFHQSLLIGGDQAPAMAFVDPIGEFFFVRRGGFRGQTLNVADRRFGIDWRLQIPFVRNAEWYAETLWDDFGRATLHANVTEQMGWITGFYFPLLNADGSMDLRVEYTHIPPSLYRHEIWTSGHTLNRRLSGSEVGPDGDQFAVTLGKDLSNCAELMLNIAYDNRDSDTYTQTTSSKDGPDRVVKVHDNPTEHRLRLMGGISWLLRKDIKIDLRSGYERVFNFNFNTKDNQDNFLGAVMLRYYPFTRAE